MAYQIEKLTPEQEALLPAWEKKWIEIGLRTGETDWDTFDKNMPILYQQAGLEYPKNVVRVNSPIVGALAASIADTIWREKNGTVDGAVGEAVGKVVSEAVDEAVEETIGIEVERAVGAVVERAVGVMVDRAVKEVVDRTVRAAVGEAVEKAVDRMVEGVVEVTIGDAVGRAVGEAVGKVVSEAVDGAVEEAVREAVGVEVEVAVGGVVDIAVREAIKRGKINWHPWMGGQFWVGWGSFYWRSSPSYVSFFTDVCGLKLPKDILKVFNAYRKICESVNYIWLNRNFVIVCARPKAIHRDENGRLHSAISKSIEYPDGWGLYHLWGVRFPEDLWYKVVNRSIPAIEILKMQNQEQRIAALRIYGWDRVIDELKPVILDEKTLLIGGQPLPHSVLQVEKDGWIGRFLRYTDPSDGRQGLLRVDHRDDSTKSVEGARAYGFRPMMRFLKANNIEFVSES